MVNMQNDMSVYGDLALWDMRYISGWQRQVVPLKCRQHSHGTFEIVYHPSGAGYTCCGNSAQLRLDFDTGWIVIYPPGVAHYQQLHTGGEDVCVHLVRAGFDADIDFDSESDSSVSSCWPAELKIAVAADVRGEQYIVRELIALANTRTPATELAKSALDRRASALWSSIISLMATGHNSGDASDSLVARARQYIYRNCCEIQRIAEVAEALDISADYLRHLYKQCYDVSMQSDLRKARLRYAADLLVHSDLPLKAIARMSALSSEQYFCTSFKWEMGCTPDEFRRRA